jgi:hypothetical protein
MWVLVLFVFVGSCFCFCFLSSNVNILLLRIFFIIIKMSLPSSVSSYLKNKLCNLFFCNLIVKEDSFMLELSSMSFLFLGRISVPWSWGLWTRGQCHWRSDFLSSVLSFENVFFRRLFMHSLVNKTILKFRRK